MNTNISDQTTNLTPLITTLISAGVLKEGTTTTQDVKVAYIQTTGLMTEEQIQNFMPLTPYLISNNPTAMLNFILLWNARGVKNFVLNINSQQVLDLYNLGMFSNTNLIDSLFVATFSNANSIRDLSIPNLYFSLSAVNVVIAPLPQLPPTRSLLVVSDTSNPYYNQIYNVRNYDRYRLSDLTIPILNTFALTGSTIFVALDTPTEYNTFEGLIIDPSCNYTRQINFIEIDLQNIPVVTPLLTKVSSIVVTSSGVGICASTSKLPTINNFVLYDNCSIQLVNNGFLWNHFISTGIVSKGIANRNTNLISIFP
jgi:hypothetical protein